MKTRDLLLRLKIMSKITKSLNLNLNIKIGGCEAINDIIFCKSLRPKSIVAPMVESQYALENLLKVLEIKKDKTFNKY